MKSFKVGDELLCISVPDHKSPTSIKIGEVYTCLGVFNGNQIAISEYHDYAAEHFILADELNKALS
jgi:hypothetical protein